MAIDNSVSAQKPVAPKKTIEELKNEASKMIFGVGGGAEGLNGDEATGNGGNGNLPSLNGNTAPPAGYSQTGEFVGVAPVKVNGDPSNPSLPPVEIAKRIACKFFPNCKYGDECAFAHGNAENGAAPNGEAKFRNPYQNGFTPNLDFNHSDAHQSQGGMPVPMEYAQYMSYMTPYGNVVNMPPYYGAYHGATYPPLGAYGVPPSPYGYMQPHFKQPPPPHQMALSPTLSAPLSDSQLPTSPRIPEFSPDSTNGQPGQQTSPMQESPVDNLTAQPQSPTDSTFSYSQQNTTNSHNSNHINFQHTNQQQTDMVMAASGLRKSTSQHRRANSLGNSANGNRRMPVDPSTITVPAFAGSAASQTPIYPRAHPDRFEYNPRPKRAAVLCNFFATRECLNGDGCHFAHPLPDGTDAKMLAQNIISANGRKGDAENIEAFRVAKEAAGLRKGFVPKHRENFMPQNQFPPQINHKHQNGHFNNDQQRGRPHPNHQNRAQRIPSGSDFPALNTPTQPGHSGSPSENGHPQIAQVPEPTVSPPKEDEVSAKNTENEPENEAPRTFSFASAAARGAAAPTPVNPPRKAAAKPAQAQPSAHATPTITASPLPQSVAA